MIGHGFRNVARFAGRDARSTFWPYAGVVVAGGMATAMLGIVPLFATTFARMQRFAAEHPDQAEVSRSPGGYQISIEGNHPELMPDFGAFAAITGVVTIVVALLLAAAVARRLHDGGLSGAWGLMPLPFLAGGLGLMPMLFATAGEPSMTLFLLLFCNNVVYLATLAVLVLLLCRRTRPVANRFGPPAEPS